MTYWEASRPRLAHRGWQVGSTDAKTQVCVCRGKLLNVRDASAVQISGNAEIQAIKQIMGLQHNKVRASEAATLLVPSGEAASHMTNMLQAPARLLAAKLAAHKC